MIYMCYTIAMLRDHFIMKGIWLCLKTTFLTSMEH